MTKTTEKIVVRAHLAGLLFLPKQLQL